MTENLIESNSSQRTRCNNDYKSNLSGFKTLSDNTDTVITKSGCQFNKEVDATSEPSSSKVFIKENDYKNISHDHNYLLRNANSESTSDYAHVLLKDHDYINMLHSDNHSKANELSESITDSSSIPLAEHNYSTISHDRSMQRTVTGRIIKHT